MEETVEPSVTEETQESTGLLDGANPEPEESTEVNPHEAAVDHRDPAELKAQEEFAVKEAGEDAPQEIPDWWPENFITKDKAKDEEALVKSWKDLRKQISQGKHKAPADGEYDISAFGDIAEDDPVRSHVMNWAKEYQVSQAALDDLVGQVVEMQVMGAKEASVNIEQEKKMLGPNAEARIQGMAKWGQGLVQKGVWSSDDFEEFKIMGGTARGIAALEKLRASLEGRIPTESAPVDGTPSKEELQQLVADPKYQTDPSYRAKVERAFQQVYG